MMNPRVGTVGTTYFLQTATNIDCSLRIFHSRTEWSLSLVAVEFKNLVGP